MSEMNFGADVSDRGIFSADDLMQLQNDADGYAFGALARQKCAQSGPDAEAVEAAPPSAETLSIAPAPRT